MNGIVNIHYFLHPPTSEYSASFRYFLTILLDKDIPPEELSDSWATIKSGISYFEKLLRAEIGIFDIKPAEQSKELSSALAYMGDTIKTLNNKYPQIRDKIIDKRTNLT